MNVVYFRALLGFSAALFFLYKSYALYSLLKKAHTLIRLLMMIMSMG
jgi:hypothetical protein